MNLSQPFIEPAVATSLLMAALGFVGLVVKEGDAMEARKIAVGPSPATGRSSRPGLRRASASLPTANTSCDSRVTVKPLEAPAIAHRNGSS
jgi:hypothetical protein